MPFFSAQHLRVALDYMSADLHPSLTSMLAMLRSGVKSGDASAPGVRFGSTNEKQLLIEYMSPAGGPVEFPYYMPFGPDPGQSRWRNGEYPGKALQRMRSDRKEVYQQAPPKGSGVWSFAPDLVSVVLGDPGRYIGETPVRVAPVAAWFYRLKPFADVAEAVAAFVDEFKLKEAGLVGPLFDGGADPAFDGLPLAAEPVTPSELIVMLEVDKRDTAARAAAPGGPEGEATPTVAITGPEKPAGDWAIDTRRLYEALGLAGMEEAALRCVAALVSGRHVILTGPPGTGKTTLAEGVCKAAAFPAHTVSATDQWTTFETIGGYFPTPTDAGPQDRLDFLPGAVVGAIEKGMCVVIDEINRADIDKAFGEFLTLLAGKPGSVVTLPYRRRGTDGGLHQLQLQVGAAVSAASENDVVVIPSWWRLIGTMNDSDKGSLKRLSSAFMRRFVFVPVELPEPAQYERVIRDEAARHSVPGGMPWLTDTLVDLFTRRDGGFAAIGAPLGPSFPLDMLRQASSEWTLDPTRSKETVLMSCLEGLADMQFQGREDLHEKLVELVRPLMGEKSAAFSRRLAVWTGADIP